MNSMIEQLLQEIETEHNVVFADDVRLAIEARTWLLRIGVPYYLEGLLRSTLRQGFGADSAFKGLDVCLTPRAATATLPADAGGAPAAFSQEVADCLRLAGRICSHFSRTQYVSSKQTVTIKQGHLGQDAVLFALAYTAPEVITANLAPAEIAQWIRKIAHGVAQRALCESVSPSTMYDLKEIKDVQEFLNARSLLKGWYLQAFLSRDLVTNGEQYVYMAASESTEPGTVVAGAITDQAPGSHSSFCFMGVPAVTACPDWGQLKPPVRIVKAHCERGEIGGARFVLTLDPTAAQRAEVAPTVVVEFVERLTVEEYTVAAR